MHVVEQFRDAGTILLLIGIGFLLFDFPGAEAWIVIGILPLALALGFFAKDHYSTWQMISAQ